MTTKGGTGGGGWVHPEVADGMAVSGLHCRKDLVGTGWAISIVFGVNALSNKLSCLVWLQHSWVIFQLRQVAISRET